MIDQDVNSFIRVLGEELSAIAGMPVGDRVVLLANVRALVAAHEKQEDALQRIVQWSEAYPLDIFPEPNLQEVREILAERGITLDAVSAHCMRHVIMQVGKIAQEALEK